MAHEARNEELRQKFDLEELKVEQDMIERTFLTLRFGQQMRINALGCFKGCGGAIKYPFRVYQYELYDKNMICFSDCMNMQLERNGPSLSDLEKPADDKIPKKFIWSTEEDMDYMSPLYRRNPQEEEE